MQEAILILCAVAGIMTATLLRRGKVDTEASILELSIKKLETDTSYAAEKDVLLPIYNNKLKNLKSNSTKESHVTHTTEQTTDSVSSVKQDVKSDRIGATSTSKSNIRDKSDNVTEIAPAAKTDVGPKPDTTEAVGAGATPELQQKPKADMRAKPSVVTPGVLPADDSGKKSKSDTGEVGAGATPELQQKPKADMHAKPSVVTPGVLPADDSGKKSKSDTGEVGAGATPELQQKPKADMHAKPSVVTPGVLPADDSGKESKPDTIEAVGADTTPVTEPKSTKPERKLKIQSKGVVADTTPVSEPKSTKPERKLKIQSKGVVAQESDNTTDLNIEPQSKLTTEGTVAQDLPTIINVESEADTPDVELKDASKIDETPQTNPAKLDTKSINKTTDEAKSIVEPSQSIESVIDDDIDEEELEKIKNSVKEALAKLERAESE